ncbi:MAG: tRNA (adenosine(37)-N6)-threonylcarbamoyltransferase complex ATPase subunit type 1 TsaE [Pseudomonadota bacterium]
MKLSLSSLAETQALAHWIALILKAGDVIALHGGLGAGKTTFSRALISGLMGAETDVPSPTYTLVQTYKGPHFPIFHFDLYRLEAAGDVFELGWDETVDGIALIEWPDRAGAHLPEWRLDLTLEVEADTETRTVTLEPRGEDWQIRLHELSSHAPSSD